MKAKTFENLIRKVVREEIDYALRREIKTLKEDLRDELKPTITEHKEKVVEIPESTKNSLKDVKRALKNVTNQSNDVFDAAKWKKRKGRKPKNYKRKTNNNSKK